MLPENGRKKPNKKYGQKITCPYCKAKLILENLQEEGNVTKIANVTICTCNKCYEEFNI